MSDLTILAVDDADDDGGTLYVLYDGPLALHAASWPHPLEAYAAKHGRGVTRAAYVPTLAGECEPPRRKEKTMVDDLMDEVHDAVVADLATPTCKIEGCVNEAVGKASFTGLCATHRSQEATRRNNLARDNHPRKKTVTPIAKPAGSLLVEIARQIETLRGQRDAIDQELESLVAEFVRAAG